MSDHNEKQKQTEAALAHAREMLRAIRDVRARERAAAAAAALDDARALLAAIRSAKSRI